MAIFVRSPKSTEVKGHYGGKAWTEGGELYIQFLGKIEVGKISTILIREYVFSRKSIKIGGYMFTFSGGVVRIVYGKFSEMFAESSIQAIL